MFGYVVPAKNELRVREYEIYGAYYCAICHSIRDRYGQIPRLLLSFDSVFLALVYGSVFDLEERLDTFRCFVNPAKKKHVLVSNASIDYAADVMLALGYFKLKDDKEDEGGVLASVGEAYLRRIYARIAGGSFRSAEGNLTERLGAFEGFLAEISSLEKAGECDVDKVAEPFGLLMAEVFDFPDEDGVLSLGTKEALRKIGYHLGRWIYIIDAVDDLDEDILMGRYNPLRAGVVGQGQGHGQGLDCGSEPAMTGLAMTGLGVSLRLDLSEIAAGVSRLPLLANKEIIENIVYVGMNEETDRVLTMSAEQKKDYRKRSRRLYGKSI
ncbi:MAG: DUF5685 family protein [Clostridiales Family XIII bacterium]|jgi:hypothetical protein|nr:DUF5685 family protein [Clostridiales Family XIII bacterium]